MDAVLQEDICGTENVLALVGGVGHVMQAPLPAAMLLGAGKIIGLVVDREPAAAGPPVIELDQFGDAGPEADLHELAEYRHVFGQQIEMVDPARRSAGKGRGSVLERCPLGRVLRFEPAGFVIEFEDVAERIGDAIGTAMAEIAVDPADGAEIRRLDGGNAAIKRFRRGTAIADMADAGRVVARQLQRVELVIVPGAQIGAVAVNGAELEPIDAGEEIEAFLETVSVHFDVSEMGDIETRIGGCGHDDSPSEFVDGAREDRLKAFGIFAVASP